MAISPAESRPDTPVLVVDDNAAMRLVVKRALEAVHVAVITSESAVEALKIVAERNIKVVITDITMPDMDGWQFCAEAHATYPNLIIGIMTGWHAAAQARLDAHGVSFVVPKPFDIRDLQAKVLAVLTRPS